MSKFVKNLISETVSRRLQGVNDAVLVDVIGMDSAKTYQVRKHLRGKNIELLVVKNSLARRACQGTPLEAAFEGVEGTAALCWGSEDFISLVKEIVELDKGKEYEKFVAKGGVMDGEHLTPEKVRDISKWPNRQEQLSLLMGQILSPGANLSGALLGPGGKLASQIEEKSKGEEGAGDESPAEEGGEASAAPADAESPATESPAPDSSATESPADEVTATDAQP